MRVTKIIREYVEKRVKEVYGEKTEIEKKYDEEKAKFEKEIEKANKEMRKMIEEYAEKNIKNPYGFKLDITTSYTYSKGWHYSSDTKSELEIQAKDAENERAKKKQDALENIFVTLELGGNKAQLEEMLNNLK